MEELKKSTNKYHVLEELDDTKLNEYHIPSGKQIVDKFIKYQRQPTLEDSKGWTQEMLNPDQGIFKKIDRVMGNNSFMGRFCNSTTHFIPHLTSDHCHAILNISKILAKKKRAFRFTNYIAGKPEFWDIVKREWNIEVEGFQMFKTVKKLKAMKFHMKSLNSKHGNLYEKVNEWKSK
nr:hypothetical protein [Tanacetum cinerariifolium]